eukprot:2794249-Pyramimonas_sp.AAC.1
MSWMGFCCDPLGTLSEALVRYCYGNIEGMATGLPSRQKEGQICLSRRRRSVRLFRGLAGHDGGKGGVMSEHLYRNPCNDHKGPRLSSICH